MNQRDYNYYEANAADVRLEEITSSEENRRILQQVRDGNLISIIVGSEIYVNYFDHFPLNQGDDLGWLGYFISKSDSLQKLYICGDSLHWGSPEDQGREQQIIIHALSDGLARNTSLRNIFVKNLSSDQLATLARRLDNNMMHIEDFTCQDLPANNDPLNDCVMLGNLLELGMSKLERLSLLDCNIGDAGVAALTLGLRSIGSSLINLDLSNNSIGSEGLTALASALANATCIQYLNLNLNDFSMAAVGLRSLSDWLQTFKLDVLYLESCFINDEGLQALTTGAVNNCKYVHLSCNDINSSGFRHLSNSLQSESCRLVGLYLANMDIGDDGAKDLARGLFGNKELRDLYIQNDIVASDEGFSFSPAGWSAFSSILCNTSSVNSTYLSNHTIIGLWDQDNVDDDDVDEDVFLYLQLNEKHPQYAARCKILMSHTHLDMTPLLEWELKCLPLAVGWFERAKPCATLPTIFDESDTEFESRVLTALYEFVRGVPRKVLERRDELILVAAYDEKIAMFKKGNKRLREDVDERDRTIAERDRKITRLGEENERLRGIVNLVRNALDS